MQLSSFQSPQQSEVLAQIRQKVQELNQIQLTLKDKNKALSTTFNKYSDELNVILRERELQERKSRSLVLLVTDIQRQLDDVFMQDYDRNEEELQIEGENKMLRELLVKVTEKIKEDQKLLSFLRQASVNGSKSTEFVQRSQYLENQTELLAKLRSQISSLSNPNLECTRKWSELSRESTRLQREHSFLKIQLQRLKTDIREHYETYLESLNRSKTSLVSFNETQREKIITDHLVEEIAFLQENRLSLQEQGKNLKYHQEALLEENARIQMENRELRSFFVGPTGDEEHKLASKMRARVEELRDLLLEVEKVRQIPQLPFNNLAERVRSKLRSLEETKDFIEKKIREEEEGKPILDEKDITAFFEKVIKGKDEKITIAKETQYSLSKRAKQLTVKKQLLHMKISNLQQGLRYFHYENSSARLNSSALPHYQTTTSQSAHQPRPSPSLPSPSLPAEGVSKWRDKKLVETNLATTTSKFLAN